MRDLAALMEETVDKLDLFNKMGEDFVLESTEDGRHITPAQRRVILQVLNAADRELFFKM